MISSELLALLMVLPCQSPIVHAPGLTTVVMCPAPALPVPAVPPWWRPGITEEPYSVKIERPKAVAYSYPAKKKKRKARRR